MKSFALLFLLAFVGVAAAFFRPAVPFQVQTMPHGEDTGLDNKNVEMDEKITPARKCGFCMGVSVSVCVKPSACQASCDSPMCMLSLFVFQ